MKKICIGLLFSLLLLSGCNLFGTEFNALRDYDYSQMKFVQLEEPEDDRLTCVIETSLGTITAVLYPEYAPNTVQNFVDRVNEKYYDNKPIYLVYNDVSFLTGADADNVNSGKTGDGEEIEAECSVNLWPFKGALMSYHHYIGKGDSRFLVVDSYPVTEEEIEEVRATRNTNGEQYLPEELLKVMMENEGVWGFSGTYTIFGQTIDGFDVIEKITAVEIDEKTYKPLEEIMVISITLTTYGENQN